MYGRQTSNVDINLSEWRTYHMEAKTSWQQSQPFEWRLPGPLPAVIGPEFLSGAKGSDTAIIGQHGRIVGLKRRGAQSRGAADERVTSRTMKGRIKIEGQGVRTCRSCTSINIASTRSRHSPLDGYRYPGGVIFFSTINGAREFT